MLNDIPNVMTELAPKGPRFVEIIEIMDRPDIPFAISIINCIWINRCNLDINFFRKNFRTGSIFGNYFTLGLAGSTFDVTGGTIPSKVRVLPGTHLLLSPGFSFVSKLNL